MRSKAAAQLGCMACCCALALGLFAQAQQTAPAQPSTEQATQQGAQSGTAQAPAEKAEPKAETPQAGSISEEELKQLLVGKPLYLRGGYLDNSLSFNEHGVLSGHSPQGSYTLSAVEIDKVRLTKHKVELTGARYGLHFLGALPYEDPTKSLDRVKITPKKKVLKITIDRELVVTPKKKKDKDKDKKEKTGAWNRKGPSAESSIATAQPELSEAEQTQAEIAAAPAEERPADPGSVTRTTSPAHAAKMLKDALDKIFAQGFDERLMASMPDFWKLYYQAVAAKADYRPRDPAVLRQNTVDKKARLLSTFEPESNEYAQANAVAGMALYHTVIGTDGKPGEIAVGRPIGFGLDENAVEAIRKASFEPAMKDGKPVPVMLDLVVQFRIYSKRTAVTNKQEPEAKQEAEAAKPEATVKPALPGPYSVQH
ncbi:MAG: energy transducer TonB [Terracidiphilus sp.]|nr:energy transducer TonB [Terracidiphilus sp.]MDR3777081.1 energy transducer TonB [Terracidiphilus sp.]